MRRPPPGPTTTARAVDSASDESDTTNNCSAAATVTVERTNRSPQLTGDVDDKVVELGESFTVDLSGLFTDPDGDEITSYGFTYRTRGILAGLVRTKTGILSLSAIAVGETIVAVSAGDSNGQWGVPEDLFKVTVVAAEAATDTQQDTSACATGGAVPDAANNPGLVSDCEALLVGKDTLVGTGTLNWSADVPMVRWDGVSVGNSPIRVLRLNLGDYRLNGEIPPELGRLSNLTYLYLHNNQLTGEIPPELGGLSNLTLLVLYGNQLTGEIPPELGGLSNLTGLSLSGNQLTGEIPPELGGLSLSNLTLGPVSLPDAGAVSLRQPVDG